MGGQTDGRMDGWMGEGWMGGQMEGWMGGQMEGWMGGQTDGWSTIKEEGLPKFIRNDWFNIFQINSPSDNRWCHVKSQYAVNSTK